MKTNNIVLTIISIIFIYFIIALFKTDGARITLDYNCSDFQNREEAIKVFLSNEEDIYKLDGDKDGIPCESLK